MLRPTQNFLLDDLKLVVEPKVRQFCGPLFFTDSLETPSGVSNNGSFGLVDTGSKKLLVTCYHVWEGFQEARKKNSDLKMCVCLNWGPFVVLDAEKLVAKDEKLDIATFDMEHLSSVCDKRKFYPLHQNPPRKKLGRGDMLLFVGFPGHFRRVENGALGFGRQGFVIGVADSYCNGFKFVSNIKSLNVKPDVLSGISGSPCFLVRGKFPIQLPPPNAVQSHPPEFHRHAVALFVAVFNFCRVHKSLNGKTPAMAARLTNHKWTIEELLSAQI